MNALRSQATASDTDLAEQISCGSAELGVALGTDQLAALVAYLRMVERWNATYNLTSVRDPRAMVVQHVLDCIAAVAALLRRRGMGNIDKLLDVGSGAGLPGLVVATVLPGIQVTCVDSVGKKAAFMTHAAGAMRLANVVSMHGRIEALVGPRFTVIASRAFASLADFVALTRHLLAPGGEWMAMKGKVPYSELQDLSRVRFHVEPLLVPGLPAQRCVVWMEPDLK